MGPHIGSLARKPEVDDEIARFWRTSARVGALRTLLKAGPAKVISETQDSMSQTVMGRVGSMAGALFSIETKLRDCGLRPTRQRIALAELLFAKGDRHLTVEELHEEAIAADVPVSLATVYNTLHQFTEAGMIRVLAVEGAKTYFDTNVSDHHHFFIEGRNEVLDIPVSNIEIGNLPPAPEGMEISYVDVVIRLREKKS
ncbi:transcriptional repressor [Pseudorhizobium halotolerans]|nr:transcriptional repressor [Pseudorhizobium halotolerans]